MMKLLFMLLCMVGGSLMAEMNQTEPKVVILLGPPGSGKGTQAVKLSKELNIPHISTGDLFRANVKNNTDLGKKAKQYIDAGQLTPDDLVIDMLFDRVSQPDAAHGYLLDGFPRTIQQAEELDKRLAGKSKVVVLNLDVPDELIVKRVSGRLLCKEGHIHNKYFAPPKVEGKCDTCGSELSQRPDDKAEVVLERLKVYHQQTKPLEEYYRSKKLLKTVDGTVEPEQVYQQLLNALEVSAGHP